MWGAITSGARPNYRVETLEDKHGVGSRIKVANGRLVRWVATLTHLDPERVVLRYEGAWNGEARWSVAPCQEGTRLIFRIDVDPGPLWLKLLARTRDLKRQHSHQMTQNLRPAPQAPRSPRRRPPGASRRLAHVSAADCRQ